MTKKTQTDPNQKKTGKLSIENKIESQENQKELSEEISTEPNFEDNADNFSSISKRPKINSQSGKVLIPNDSEIRFSKINFDSHAKNKPINPTAGKDYKSLLTKSLNQRKAIDEAFEKDKELGVQKLHNLSVAKAIKKAHGIKLKDDPTLLRKAAKNKEIRKNKSRKNFAIKQENLKKIQAERQEKRQKNLNERHKKSAKK